MAKLFDRIVLSTVIVILVFGWSYYFTRSIKAAAIAAGIACLICLTVSTIFRGRAKVLKHVSPEEAVTLLALIGGEAAAKLFYSTVPEDMRIKIEKNRFVYSSGGENILVWCAYKFADLTGDELAAACRAAEENGIKKIKLLTRAKSRKTAVIAAYSKAEISYPDRRVVYRYLYKHNALPTAPQKRDRKERPEWREILRSALDRRKIKYYIFTGILTAATSFITPYKLYYMLFATVPLALAAVSAAIGEKI